MAETYEEKRWTSADGLSLYYRDYPGPPGQERLPVLCLHGLTRNSRDFADLAEHLCKTRRVIVPEMRGRGNSDYAPDAASYNPGQYVDDIEILLEEEGIDRFVAIGTSMGGLLTMMLSAARPGRVAGFVINDIGPAINPAGVERISGYVGQGKSYPTWVHAARALAEVHAAAFPDYDLERWLKMAKQGLVVGQNGRISLDYDMGIAEAFRQPGNAAPADLWPAFATLENVQLLLVVGELSDLITPTTIARMREINPAMRTVTVPRVGHAPSLDEPEARAAIDALLEQV